jgi:hypothetical protein
MMETEVELLYFTNDVKRIKGIDLSKDKINEICTKSDVSVKFKDKTHDNMPQLSIDMYNIDESVLRICVKEILTLYGKPDLPGGLFLGPEKKRGNELVKYFIKELSL